MAKYKDMVGQRFGRLTVIEYAGTSKNRKAMWICKCDCGCITEPIIGSNLRDGTAKSCGCFRNEVNSEGAKHNYIIHKRLYGIWHGMKQRCYWENYKQYKDYGGRGIIVCDEWKDDFDAFYEWAIKNGYTNNLTIDRIDNDGNYEPSNCRWATKAAQNRNRRICRNISKVCDLP